MTDVRGWDSESGRSVAAVTWSSGSTNVYRVGHKGKVDLKYMQAAGGGYYYRDHLPVLGEYERNRDILSVVPRSRFLGDTGVPLPEFQGDIHKFWRIHQSFKFLPVMN